MADRKSPEPTSGPVPTGIDLAAVLATEGTDRATFRLKIDKYELKESIGGGGMGVVFEAIHDDLGHSVALKLMKHRASSPEALERFIREARVLASCHHQGIAQVYDAGIHHQGQQEIPYYVMEFVRGARTITRYADEKHLSIDQRLDLFARVCDAMQSVHDLGIIHRDIKPENILVDSSGQPKVIDFGVARVLNADLPLPASHTAADSLLGTLPYMSPEQTGSEAGHIDKRSDVYSLGVVLYELLCGRLPYSVKDKTISQAIEIIREAPPAKPRAVNPALDEDIETILLKVLHKDRDRRYRSPGDLAASIRHRLRGEPIPDRRDSATYVLRKRASALVAAHRVSMWLMVTIGSLLAAEAIGVGLARFTSLNLWFERTVTTWIRPAGFVPFKNVSMVALLEGTDLVELGRTVGVTVNLADRTTMRPVFAALMFKLAEGLPRVVVYDIGFAPVSGLGCPYEKELLAGIRALKNTGCPVVMACGGKWQIGEDDLPSSMCKSIASETLWGFTRASLGSDAPWSLHLICSPKDRNPMASLALAACAAYWRPDRHHWVSIEHEARTTIERYARIFYVRPESVRQHQWGAPAETATNAVRLSSSIRLTNDDLEHGIREGDWIGHYILQVPSDAAISTATIDLAKALTASQGDLRHWFEGKVVLVGNARADGRDGPFQAPDGRSYPGFVAHAIGIDSILSNNTILAPDLMTVLGVSIGRHHLFAAAGTFAGAWLGVFALQPSRRRRALTAALLLIIACTSVLIYWQGHVLLDPLVAMLGALLGAETVSAVSRMSGARMTVMGWQ